MRILLVEDEDSIRSALTRGLERAGHAVQAADSLAAARAVARPDAVVCDLKLPDGSGLDLIEALAVPGVVMSGYATFDDAVRALRLGCVDFLTKPVGIKDVRAALERIRPPAALVIDAERGESIRPDGGREPLAMAAADWRQGTAEEAWARLRRLAATRAQRAALAVLLQEVGSGRLVINADARSWRAWRRSSDPKPDGQDAIAQEDKVIALEAGEAQDEAGEWWWPRPLQEPIDLQGVVAVGPWFLAWLAAHPGVEAVGAAPALRQQLAGTGVRWRDEALAQPGVGAVERALLFDDG